MQFRSVFAVLCIASMATLSNAHTTKVCCEPVAGGVRITAYSWNSHTAADLSGEPTAITFTPAVGPAVAIPFEDNTTENGGWTQAGVTAALPSGGVCSPDSCNSRAMTARQFMFVPAGTDGE